MAFETWRRREVAGGDLHYVLYAVRVPAEARLDHDALVALGNDDEFGAALAAWLKNGLYASFDGYQIRLRAPRGFGVDHEVFLDQTTLQASSAPVRPGES